MILFLHTVTRALDYQNIRFLLIGGLAVNQYRAVRQTFDIDIAIPAIDALKARDALTAEGLSPTAQTDNFIRFRAPEGPAFLCDILLMDGSTFDKLWAARQERTVGRSRIGVASPDHLVRMKLHSLVPPTPAIPTSLSVEANETLWHWMSESARAEAIRCQPLPVNVPFRLPDDLETQPAQ